MKKCEYCNETMVYKKDKITQDENKGRGIYCRLCGSFIAIPREFNNRDSHLHNSNRRSDQTFSKNRRRRRIILIVFLIIQIYILWYFISYIGPFNGG